jgi:two-component system sensor histidine kinase and response regulator WspE
MVRGAARSLGKLVRLEIIGDNTQVDRDILDRLEAPLLHLLRNAVDYGCEFPDVRRQAGKPAEAVIRLEARHSAGMLQVIVSDDGAGLDTDRVRNVITDRQLTTPAIADKMSDGELLQFLFLPGYPQRCGHRISGLAAGPDVIKNMAKAWGQRARYDSRDSDAFSNAITADSHQPDARCWGKSLVNRMRFRLRDCQ